jgi:transcriptional regulator with XRE-family HTH domain
MTRALPVSDWMEELGMNLDDLVEATKLERQLVEAIACGRYTPTAEQRQLVAQALTVDPEAVFWGHVNQVEHVYGHGPQFGRSP